MIILVSCVRIQLLNNSHILEVCQPQNNRRPRNNWVQPGKPLSQHPVPCLGGSKVKTGRGSSNTKAGCEDGAVWYVHQDFIAVGVTSKWGSNHNLPTFLSAMRRIGMLYLDHQIQSNTVLQWVIVGKRCRKSSLTNSATWQSLQINAAFENTQ